MEMQKQSSNIIPKVVGMIFSPDYWYLQTELCRLLKKNFQTKICVYVGCKQDLKFLRQTLSSEFYDHAVIHNAHAYPYEKSVDCSSVVSRASIWEEFLGTTIQDLTMASRIYGRGYSLGGYYYPRSFTSEKFDYYRMLDVYTKDLDFWDNEIRNQKIDLFINPYKPLAVLARRHGIQTRFLSSARHENYYYWVNDEFGLNPDIEKNFFASPILNLEEEIEAKGYGSDIVFRTTYFNFGIRNVLIDSIRFSVKRIVDHIKRNQSSRSTYIRSEIYRSVRKYIDIKRMTKGKHVTTPEEIFKNDFFYFPLQTEPEWTLQVQSPGFFSQLFCIALICRATPAHLRLVVKEHIYPIGSRPQNFYDQIADFKIVQMAPATLHGIELMKRCKAVVTINGTSGYEAAMMGIPVIVLAERCDYAFLKHVFHCPKGEGMDQAMREILSDSQVLKNAKAEGAHFLKAIISSSFSIGDYSVRNRKEIPELLVQKALDKLVESLN